MLMPKVEEIAFVNIIINPGLSSADDLDLPNLRKLTDDNSWFNCSFFLESIPKDILTELVFRCNPQVNRFQRFLDRQSNIRKLEVVGNNAVTIDHLRLDYLSIKSNRNVISILGNQPNLRTLIFPNTPIEDGVFAAACELKHLEVFATSIDGVSCRTFKSLEKLSKLKELRLESFGKTADGEILLELSMMKCFNQLKKLALVFMYQTIPEEILNQMSRSFKGLRQIKIMNRSMKVVTAILKHFPLIESILFYSSMAMPDDILEISDDFSNKLLKQIVIKNVGKNSKSLLKLVNASTNLERIILSELHDFTDEDLQEIFDCHPKLSHLSLTLGEFQLSSRSVAIIKASGSNLAYLHLDKLVRFKELNEQVKVDLIEITFPKLIFFDNNWPSLEIIMRDRKIRDWHLNVDMF